MAKTLRPSRRWGHFLKYYIIAFLLILPYSVKILKGLEHQLVISLVDIIGSWNLGGTLSSFLPSGALETLGIPLFGLGLLIILTTEVRRFRIRYVLYGDRVVKKVGILITSIKDVSYDHTDSISTTRTITEKILGTADLTLETPASMDSMVLKGIASPEKWFEYIMKRANLT